MAHITGWATDARAMGDFLAEPNLCRVATVDESGDPHVVPAWYWWDGERFWLGSDAADHKVGNIRRTGRATIEVDADLRRKIGLVASGRARLIENTQGRREYVRISAEQVRRYRPEKPPIETAERMAGHGTPVVIELTPERIRSWGR